MASPRVLGYDDLHNYLEEAAQTHQELADDHADMAGDGHEASAQRHWAKAEAYREMVQYIEQELRLARG